MTEKKNAVLNLDELFGVARPIKVILGGRTYEMVRPEALSPKGFVQWDKLQRRAMELQVGADGEMSEEMTAELEDVISEAIYMACPGLREAELNFPQKVSVLNFYAAEVAPEKKAIPPQ